MINWKTTVTGILTAVAAVTGAALHLLNGTAVDWPTTIAALTAALGLITAKDKNVTGGTVQQ